MPFLILTHAGLRDAEARAEGAALYVNPSLVPSPEIEQLRAKGAQIHVLATDVDPQAAAQVQDAVRFVAQAAAGQPVWLEQGIRKPVEATQPAEAAAQEEEVEQPAARRIAETAGKFALKAIKSVGRVIGQGRQLMIMPYSGFGTPHKLHVRGRVLEAENFREQSATDSRWRNLAELYKRLESDEVPGAEVIARFQGAEYRGVSDAAGYFVIDIELPAPISASGWLEVDLELAKPVVRGGAVTAKAEVLVPPPSARFGVISDIDDTVLWSNVTNKMQMLRMLMRSNAHTRKPFKGVGAFYRALHRGAAGNEGNPVFYVSSSPWHLYGPLTEFFRLQGIPHGPLLLKELGIRQVFGSGRHHTHKLDKIESIIRCYPGMKFVLIGDSGEQDPELYSEAVRRHPAAIRVIYIRNVNPDPSRIDAIDKLIEEVSATGAQLILTLDSVAAATHAAGEGLVDISAVAAVRADQREDEATAP